MRGRRKGTYKYSMDGKKVPYYVYRAHMNHYKKVIDLIKSIKEAHLSFQEYLTYLDGRTAIARDLNEILNFTINSKTKQINLGLRKRKLKQLGLTVYDLKKAKIIFD